MIKVINVVGARPNFMKVAPIVEAMKRRELEFTPLLVHTGQHYDAAMSDAFFNDLDLPAPDVHLGVGSASHAAQTAAIMGALNRWSSRKSRTGFWWLATSIPRSPAPSFVRSWE